MTASTGTELAQYRTDTGNPLGLDEIDAGDMVSPRFSIDHNKGVWVNSLTKAEYAEFTAVLLCRVKGRIMWKDKLEDKADPQCRSNNFHMGFPNQNPHSKPEDRFPWDRSVFRPEDFPADPVHNGLSVLPCDSCDFKNWHGDDKPPCKEQWIFAALIFLATPGAPNGEWMPALLTIQGTGLSSVRPYISSFVQKQAPLFTQMTQVSLRPDTKGKNVYYVPVFSPAAGTNPDDWASYAARTEAFVSYLKQDPRPYERDDDSTATPPTAAPAITAAPEQPVTAETVSEPEPPPAESSAGIVDAEVVPEGPVSTPPVAPAQPAVATPAPAAPAPATAPEPAVTPPSPAPSPAVTPAAPTPAAALPVTPAPAAQPAASPAQPAAPAASTPPVVGPGKLPF